MHIPTLNRISEAIIHRIGFMLPDKLYLELLFGAHMGYDIKIKHAETFNEKLQWLKLYNRRPEYTRLVDKVDVKDWVAERIGSEYVIPTYKVWDSPEEIDLSELPDKFVLKCNHTGGNTAVLVVDDKSKFDLESARRSLKKAMGKSVYRSYREWPYKNVRHRILAEEMLGVGIEDFKFFCYDGFVESVMVAYERNTGSPKFYFFDKDWNLKRYNIRGKEAPEDFTKPRPKNIEKMFEIASELSKGIPFVRVDLYNVDGHIYFGEMTFFPASGLDEKLLPETDDYFGSLIKLPEKKVR